MLSGMATRMINVFQGKSNIIIVTKNLHRISGVIAAIICKINTYLMWSAKSAGLWILLAVDIIFLILWIIRRYKFPKL
jgi:uncharacterized membrane protein (UPF0136 family)